MSEMRRIQPTASQKEAKNNTSKMTRSGCTAYIQHDKSIYAPGRCVRGYGDLHDARSLSHLVSNGHGEISREAQKQQTGMCLGGSRYRILAGARAKP